MRAYLLYPPHFSRSWPSSSPPATPSAQAEPGLLYRFHPPGWSRWKAAATEGSPRRRLQSDQGRESGGKGGRGRLLLRSPAQAQHLLQRGQALRRGESAGWGCRRERDAADHRLRQFPLPLVHHAGPRSPLDGLDRENAVGRQPALHRALHHQPERLHQGRKRGENLRQQALRQCRGKPGIRPRPSPRSTISTRTA